MNLTPPLRVICQVKACFRWNNSRKGGDFESTKNLPLIRSHQNGKRKAKSDLRVPLSSQPEASRWQTASMFSEIIDEIFKIFQPSRAISSLIECLRNRGNKKKRKKQRANRRSSRRRRRWRRRNSDINCISYAYVDVRHFVRCTTGGVGIHFKWVSCRSFQDSLYSTPTHLHNFNWITYNRSDQCVFLRRYCIIWTTVSIKL